MPGKGSRAVGGWVQGSEVPARVACRVWGSWVRLWAGGGSAGSQPGAPPGKWCLGQINLARAESRLKAGRERPRQLDQSGGCLPGLGLSSGVEE